VGKGLNKLDLLARERLHDAAHQPDHADRDTITNEGDAQRRPRDLVVLKIVEERARSRVRLLGEEHCHALDPVVPRSMSWAKRTSSLRAFSASMRVPRLQVSITTISIAPTASGDDLQQVGHEED
jgi:CelD/BcsL family acetyltransferase involved in cellulose biosynthesis